MPWKKLLHSPKFLFFDLGVRRLCAQEGHRVTPERWGELFEQYVGLELLRYCRLKTQARIYFWKDADGPEVDWVLEKEGGYIPIEAKWTETPRTKDTRHLELFLSEYGNSKKAYVVCRCTRRFKLSPHIEAIPWQELRSLVAS